MIFKICVIFIIVLVAIGDAFIKNDEEVDNVINLLLSGDDIDTEKPNVDDEGDQPIFSDGIWKCGFCDVIDETKLIYTEVNDVDTNDISDDRPIVVQVGLNLEGMQCVTVKSETDATVRKETGACASDTVTLAVYNAKHFLVHVYTA